MKGDFTRSTFRPGKHYSGVRMQQGRVQLDADWNEQIDLQAHRGEAETRDVIGGCGTPIDQPGFTLIVGATALSIAEQTLLTKAHLPPVATGDFLIGPGRYYVDGILCENEDYVRYARQPDWPGVEPNKASSQAELGFKPVFGTDLYLAYLDVWTRHLTALEDDGIREVALGGPDTATRTKTVWQVKLLGPFSAPFNCLTEPPLWQDLLDSIQNGKLSARAAESAGTDGPCVVPSGAGYRRLENQLYRVEIHEVDASGAIKLLKWSRDNGSIVTRWLKQESSKPSELIVSSIGRDDVLKFGSGQYVEVSDDQRELRGEAGILVKLANAEGQVLTLDTTDPNAATVHKTDFPDMIAGRPNNPKARRWDGAQAPGAGWFELEDGVQIKFETGKYHVGDYWLIPARTATADVEWPRDDATLPMPIPQPRAGIEHHYCKLAILRRNATDFEVVRDCRELFPPLTALTTLLYESGDGQEARPGNLVPQPLCVRVVNGQAPVIGAAVQFTVEAGGGAGGGTLTVAQPVITKAPDGIAACGWTLGNAASGSQCVRVELLDAAGNPIPGQVLHFNASLKLANLLYVGGDGQEAMPNGLLPQPLRVRVINEQAPVIGARVRFKVKRGGGTLTVPDLGITHPTGNQLVSTQPFATVATVLPDGIAEYGWTLGATGPQQVEAVLLDAGGSEIPGQILEFNANVSVANQVAYDPLKCTNLAGAKTVQDAMDILGQGRQGGCCVRVGKGGEYEQLDEALKDLIAISGRDISVLLDLEVKNAERIEIEQKPGERDLHIQIAGCGPGSRVILLKPIKFSNVNSVVLRDLTIETAFIAGADEDGETSALTFDHCAEVSLRDCHLSGVTAAGKGALLSVANAHRVWLHGNVFEALLPDSLAPTLTVFESVATASKVTSPVAPTPNPGQSAFRQAALEVAQHLATLKAEPREKLQTALEKTVAEQRMILSQGEILGYAKLAALLHEAEVNPTTAFDLLLDIRRAAIKARPGTAIVLEQPPQVGEKTSPGLSQLVDVLDQDDIYVVENNDIAGVMSLYGPPAAIALSNQLSDVQKLELLSGWLKVGQHRLSNRFLGTLQMRGNQLVRVAVARKVVDELISAVEKLMNAAEKQSVTLDFELFGRCLWGDNVFEGGRSLVVCRHLTLQANEFTQFAEPLGTPGMDGANEPAIAGTVIADSTIYVANHGSGNMTLHNLSRLMDQVANQEMTVLNA